MHGVDAAVCGNNQRASTDNLECKLDPHTVNVIAIDLLLNSSETLYK